MNDKQSEGRKANGAAPGGKPDPATPEKDVIATGREAARRAGPDGPDAGEVGKTFKSPPGEAKIKP